MGHFPQGTVGICSGSVRHRQTYAQQFHASNDSSTDSVCSAFRTLIQSGVAWGRGAGFIDYLAPAVVIMRVCRDMIYICNVRGIE